MYQLKKCVYSKFILLKNVHALYKCIYVFKWFLQIWSMRWKASKMSLNNIYRLIHGHFHIGLVIIPRRIRGMITRPIWKCPCIKLFITYFRHLEKRHPYWPETKSRPIWASIWKWSCSNPITGYFPGVWKYGQFTSGHIGHTKMPLFELSM